MNETNTITLSDELAHAILSALLGASVNTEDPDLAMDAGELATRLYGLLYPTGDIARQLAMDLSGGQRA